ncbi:uncharacterized protein LOC119192206 [Manduca sexta]|uniref:uncharacterized protein LOC119192206 n=1 Tax=Manduca sexta TaxID=7130 RepID=UPI00188E54E0|nr:uncharacterized protein LOC119192206 [Manduca sexta]
MFRDRKNQRWIFCKFSIRRETGRVKNSALKLKSLSPALKMKKKLIIAVLHCPKLWPGLVKNSALKLKSLSPALTMKMKLIIAVLHYPKLWPKKLLYLNQRNSHGRNPPRQFQY